MSAAPRHHALTMPAVAALLAERSERATLRSMVSGLSRAGGGAP
jgi:hypothetical protein